MEGSHVAADFNLPRVRVPQPGAKSLALAVGKHLTNVWVGAILQITSLGWLRSF